MRKLKARGAKSMPMRWENGRRAGPWKSYRSVSASLEMALDPARRGDVDEPALIARFWVRSAAQCLCEMVLTEPQGHPVGLWLLLAALLFIYSLKHIYGAPSESLTWGYSSEQDRCGPCPPGDWILHHPGLC
uniref:Uncharacterized protein n=1 Tax=Molossus molossus TaxID=27622 RepID=A0A7J8HDS3_MOLMO|nr:hypothetical protein HJG59_011189 [Molossus molossus]